MPVVEGDAAVIAAARPARGATILLTATEAVGEGVVGGNVIHLRGGLVVPLAPGMATVDGDDGALIAGECDDAGVVGIDVDALVVIAAGRTAEASPRFAGVGGLPGDDTGDVERVGIFGIDDGNRKIAAADALFGTRVVIGRVDPGAALVVGAIETDLATGGGFEIDASGVGGRDG